MGQKFLFAAFTMRYREPAPDIEMGLRLLGCGALFSIF